MILQPDIGKRIKKARKEAGMTQKDVTGNDFTTSFLCQVEKGLINPSLKSLKTIAHRVGKPLIFFFPELEADYPSKKDLVLTFARNLLDLKSFDSAKDELSVAMKKAKEDDDKISQAMIYDSLGMLFLEKGKYIDSKKNFQKALSIFKELHMPEEIASTEISLASLFLKKKNLEDTQKSLNEARRVINKATIIDPGLNSRLEKQMGLFYISKGSKQKAINHFNKAAELYERRGTLSASAHQLNLLGEELKKEGLPFEALEIFRKANTLLERNKEIQERAEIHNKLASLLQKKQTPKYIANQYKKALGYYREAGNLKGELLISKDAARFCYENDLLEEAYCFCIEAKNLAKRLKDGPTEKAVKNMMGMIISEIKASNLHA